MPTAAIFELMEPSPHAAEADSAPQDAGDGVLAFPASISQQMFWYLELLQGEVTAFNVPLRFKLDGPLDVALLERTLNQIIERHEALRTRFAEDKGELLQIVMPGLKLRVGVIDISHLPPGRIEDEADRLGTIEARRPFHLSTGPLVRAELLKLSATHHILHVSIHHAVFDGMSMTVLTKELAAIYQAFYDGRECPLEPLDLQYGDYSVWQKEYLESDEMRRKLGYWKQKLAGMTELDLPTDRPRPPVKTWKGEIVSTLLDKPLTDRLHEIASRHGASLFHLQLAAYMILLHRYTGSTDVAVGTPVTGRTREELEPIIGVFINSLILRCDLSGNPTFGDFLEQVRDTSLEALENQELPFECLVRELKPQRDPSRNPLFQVNFNHHRSFAQAGSFGGVTLTPIPSRSPGTIFDLHFFMVERKEGWRASCDYSTDLFDRSSAERMLGHFKQLLGEIADNPAKPIGSLDVLTGAESETLAAWAGHLRDYPRDADIGSLFLATAEENPNRTALVNGQQRITYQQLAKEARHVAHELRNLGVTKGDKVAICTPQGAEMIAALIGTLLSGACVVPLDPSYPEERLGMLLEECGAKATLVAEGITTLPGSWSGNTLTLPRFGSAPDTASLENSTCGIDDAAFVLFTSGSTGRPKGVVLPHRGVIRLVRNNDFIRISQDDVFLQAAPVSFDASLLEIWGALLNGGKLVLMPDGPDLDRIASAVREQGVTILWLTAGLFQLMIDEHAGSLKGLRYLLAGGDVLSPAHVRKAMDALPGTALINGYGPTENTTFTTCHTIRPEDLTKSALPIGKPIANTTVRILDASLRPVPVGIPGELFTGGDGLALGYLNAADLTAERFIEHPEFGRLYRTGDLCRYNAEGVIEFIGRRDHQVKVRGFRIELGEIEATLCGHPGVKQAKAAVRGNDSESKRILAWIVPAEGQTAKPEELAKFLAQRLPTFMRPDGISVVETFPLSSNGKIDTSALPDPGQSPQGSATAPYEAPKDDIERNLAAMWRELLGIERIGRNDDFFSLGGHSLMALRMFSRISRESGKSLPLATLIQHPTIAKLAPLLAPPAASTPVARPLPTASKSSPKGNIVTLAKGSGRQHLFCIHGGDGGVIFYRDLASRMPDDYSFHAVESLELGNSGPVEKASIEETAAAYLQGILAIQPQGPFKLAGYSFGGVVAHEIACQLQDMGHEVEFLGLFDTHNPAAPSRNYGMGERLGVFWHQTSGSPLPERIGLLKSRILEGMHTHRKVKAELRAAGTLGPAEAYSDLRRVQIREENWRAMQAYKPRPFRGKITLFKTSYVNDKVERPADYGWSPVALSGLDIVAVSGHHLALFAPEHIETLAEALLSSLKCAPTCRPDSPHPSCSGTH
jgi:aspartate racemase